MNQNDIHREILDYCSLQLRMGGALYQEPYLGDLFKIFENGYNCGLCSEFNGTPGVSGDSIHAYAMSVNWIAGEEDATNVKAKLLDGIKNLWDSWKYAWDRSSMKLYEKAPENG